MFLCFRVFSTTAKYTQNLNSIYVSFEVVFSFLGSNSQASKYNVELRFRFGEMV